MNQTISKFKWANYFYLPDQTMKSMKIMFFHCIHYINIAICYHKMLHLGCLEEFWMCLWWIKFISLVLYVQLILFSYSSIKSSRANLNHSMEIINEKYQFSIKVKLFFEFLLLLFRNSKKHQKYFFVSAS